MVHLLSTLSASQVRYIDFKNMSYIKCLPHEAWDWFCQCNSVKNLKDVWITSTHVKINKLFKSEQSICNVIRWQAIDTCCDHRMHWWQHCFSNDGIYTPPYFMQYSFSLLGQGILLLMLIKAFQKIFFLLMNTM